MSRGLRYAWCWVVLSTLFACASTPVHYYTLTAPDGGSADRSDAARVMIDVRSVHAPTQIDRTEWMVRSGTAELKLLDNERWVSPVSQEIQAALRIALKVRLQRMESAEPLLATKIWVTLDVQRFESHLGHDVLFETVWTATPGSAPGTAGSSLLLRNCEFRAYEAIGRGYPAIAEGYQRAVQSLAEDIVSTIVKIGRKIPVECEPISPSNS